MKSQRISLPLMALTAALMLSLGACRSSSNTTADQNPQNPQASQPAPETSKNAPEHRDRDRDRDRAKRGEAAPSQPTQPPPPAQVELPAGTEVRVRLDQDLGSKISRPGDTFTATVSDPVVINGQTVIPKEARADGTVVDAKALGRFKGGAALAVRLDRITTSWGAYPVSTSSIARAEKGKGKRTGILAGGGAGLGALIGGLAGGGKGAAIGALAGAGAGTAGSAFTGNKDIVLPAETLLTFKLDHSVQITEQQ
jgi:hypothetical protein